ncbi:MAG: phytase [candidate division KSB1 bacterium]|nr:phytase [candidate division KSB1 bacterium]MDQ7065587.1 phytase [candidate division KSB1 bacterium]
MRDRSRFWIFQVWLLLPAILLAQGTPQSISVAPRVQTGSVTKDADDPAIWIHPTDPAKSLVIGTDKARGKPGLYVWDMNGKQVQYVPIERPNNVDVRYGIRIGGELVDVAVTNSRPLKELKVYKIDPQTQRLVDITTPSGIPLDELAIPYGLCLYKRPRDGALFAILSSKSGDTKNLYQYRLEDDGQGRVRGRFVGKFGNNRIKSIVEGLVADDELGYLYACDETVAIRKFYADRDLGKDDQITAFAQKDGISGDREGIAIYKCADGKGYILVSSQGNSVVKVYPREGDNGDPTKHSLIMTIDTKRSKETDGLDVTSRPAGPNFPYGFLVTHDSPNKRFNLYAWEDIAQSTLTICPDGDRPSAITLESPLPDAFELQQNYPNPFNPETQIQFELQKPGHVTLQILNLLGQPIRVLVDEQLPAGTHRVRWDGLNQQGRPMPTGIYFYQMSVNGQRQTRQLVLMR